MLWNRQWSLECYPGSFLLEQDFGYLLQVQQSEEKLLCTFDSGLFRSSYECSIIDLFAFLLQAGLRLLLLLSAVMYHLPIFMDIKTNNIGIEALLVAAIKLRL